MMNGRTGTKLSHTLAKNHHQKSPGWINFPFRCLRYNEIFIYNLFDFNTNLTIKKLTGTAIQNTGMGAYLSGIPNFMNILSSITCNK